MSERTPYPRNRMDYYDEYIPKFSKGDTIDPGLTDDEWYEFKREIYELCLARLGCDFEGDDLFHFELDLIKEGRRPHSTPVPNIYYENEEPTLDDFYKALEIAQFNLSCAQDEFDTAWRIHQYHKREEDDQSKCEG